MIEKKHLYFAYILTSRIRLSNHSALERSKIHIRLIQKRRDMYRYISATSKTIIYEHTCVLNLQKSQMNAIESRQQQIML